MLCLPCIPFASPTTRSGLHTSLTRLSVPCMLGPCLDATLSTLPPSSTFPFLSTPWLPSSCDRFSRRRGFWAGGRVCKKAHAVGRGGGRSSYGTRGDAPVAEGGWGATETAGEIVGRDLP